MMTPYYILRFFINNTPLFIWHLLSSFIAGLCTLFPIYRKKIIRKNLKFLGFQSTPKLIFLIYQHIFDTILESNKLLKEDQKRVIYTGDLGSTSSILSGGHMGNWEWISMCMPLHSDQHTTHGFYKPLKNKKFDEIIVNYRTRFGLDLIKEKEMKKPLRILQKGGNHFFAILGDQHPSNSRRATEVTFFGQKIKALNGIGFYADVLKIPVFYGHVTKPKRGKIIVDFQKIGHIEDFESREALLQAFYDKLEANIKAQPEIWLWTHKRFKAIHNFYA